MHTGKREACATGIVVLSHGEMVSGFWMSRAPGTTIPERLPGVLCQSMLAVCQLWGLGLWWLVLSVQLAIFILIPDGY